jgi:glycosyltransferase involved in cell wall biosynthesis
VRVLIVVRHDAAAKPGGDVVAAEGAVHALRGIDVDADLVATDSPDAGGYDVAHVFGIFEPAFARPQLSALRMSRTPLALSPIWWDRTDLFTLGPRFARALRHTDPAHVLRRVAELREDEERLRARPGRGATTRRREQSELIRMCDVALPGSEVEAHACANALRAADVPYLVAHYGIDDDAFEVEPVRQRSGVLCIGRIEPLKNQAGLLFALRDLDVEITLLGRAYDAEYLALCRRWATSRTRFVERIDAAELRALLRRTAVHALPSWGELPGLVSLEAAAAGARVIASSRAAEHEYLGPDAAYVDPLDLDGIRAAVLRALERPLRDRGDALDRRLGARTSEKYARTLLEGYARAVAARR